MDEIDENSPYTWKNEVWGGVKMGKKRFNYWTDFKLWIFLPCVAFDFDSWEIWIEWLCFGFTYQFYNKYDKLYLDVKPEGFIWKESREIGKP